MMLPPTDPFRILRRGRALVLWFSLLLVGVRADEPWPAVDSDLPPDPKLISGTLANGLRFAVLPNPEPRNRVLLRLLVAVGSLYERDDERGVAHLVEHMVYRDTRSHPGNSLIKFLELHGIGQGPDSNAFTGYDSTIYHLDLPDRREETLALGLHTLREYAEEVTFDPKALRVERQVVLNEKAARSRPEQRLAENNLSFLWPNSRQARRLPIGLESVITQCSPGQLAAFYDAWYRPERMAVIAVGDLQPERAVQMITAAFGSLTARGPGREVPQDLVPLAGSPSDVRVLIDPAFVGTALVLQHATPVPRLPDTHARRAEYLHLALSLAMFQNRLNRLSHQQSESFGSPQVALDNPVRGWQTVSASVGGKADNWKLAAADLEQQHRAAFLEGFTAEELRTAKANQLTAYEQSVRSAASRPSAWAAWQLAGCLLNGAVFTTAEAMQHDMVTEIETATAQQCLTAFRKAWSQHAPHVLLTGNAELRAMPTELAAVFNQSRGRPATARFGSTGETFAYTDFGPPGQFVKRDHVADLDVTLAEFANGVRLNFKPTPFEADIVDIHLSVGLGRLALPPDKPRLDLLANAALMSGGLVRHSTQEINDVLAGHALRVSFSVDDDACVFSGQCARRDLRLCLQIITAYLTYAAYRPEAMKDGQAWLGGMYGSLGASPGGPMSAGAECVLAGGDWRFGIPEPRRLFALTMNDLASWLEPEFKQGAIECALVGDVPWEEAATAAAATLGALPDRNFVAPLAGRPVLPPARPAEKPTLFLSGPTVQQAAIAWYWPVGDCTDLHLERRLRVLAEVIADRLRSTVREELGATYSPAASLICHEGFSSFNHLMAYVEVPPALVPKVAKVIDREIQQLRNHPLSPAAFACVHQPMIRAREDDPRTNAYWYHTVLRDAQRRPDRFAAVRDRTADFAAITPEEIRTLAKRFLDPKHRFVFMAGPPITATAGRH